MAKGMEGQMAGKYVLIPKPILHEMFDAYRGWNNVFRMCGAKLQVSKI